ncbi:MAG: hypothetical protein IJH37_06545 [Clostridia bacterium]|nr:hypothetical protein [Clostridia bacterium]
MNVKLFRKSLAAFAAAAVAFGGAGIQPLPQLLGTVARAVTYETITGGFEYIDRRWDGASKQFIREKVKYDGDYTTLSYLNESSSDNIILYGLPEYADQGIKTNWYYASEDLTISRRMEVKGTVNLLIANWKTLILNDGIRVPSGSTLNIYCQSAESGNLIANADTDHNAAIGGNSGESGGTVRIFGGNITANAYDHGANSAGIGGGDGGNGGTVEIYSGTVIAKGGNKNDDGGAGIGGGNEGNGGTVRIYGGNVTATGGGDGAGIGGGDSGNGGYVEIRGGTVTASSNTDAAGIGGGEGGGNGELVNIYGGTVTAIGGKYGAGIGGGYKGNGGTVNIYNGTVNATGGDYGAGIGGGEYGGGGTITISGGAVTAKGGYEGAGIGGGDSGSGGTVNISGGTVNATGGEYGAGIGGGYKGSVESITISGGNVTANGGKYGAGIGGGEYGSGGTITISGGAVTAQGGYEGAGIGGGDSGSGGTITIRVGNVNATGGDYGAGIGGGYKGSGGNITINRGLVHATGGVDCDAGIGGGYNSSDNGSLIIGESTVLYGGSSENPSSTISTSQRYRYMAALSIYYEFQFDPMYLQDQYDGYQLELDQLDIILKKDGVEVGRAGIDNPSKDSSNNIKIWVGNYADSVEFDYFTSILTSDNKVIKKEIKETCELTESRSIRTVVRIGINDFHGNLFDTHIDYTVKGLPAPEYTAPTAKTDLLYTGENQELINGGAVTVGGDMQYAIGADATTVPDDALFTTSIPTAAQFGTYYVWYRIASGKGCCSTEAEVLSPITIEYDGPDVHDPIRYQKAAFNETSGEIEISSAEVSEYFLLDDKKKIWVPGTYVLTDNVTISDRITFLGNVYLILCDGAQLTAEKGIVVEDGAVLNIYAQESGTGKLTAHGENGTDGAADPSGYAAIEGDVSVFGGTIEAYGGNGGTGLGRSNWANGNGGGYGRSGLVGDITVYRGTIKAVGGNGGIGGEGSIFGRGGDGGSGLEGNITLYGGTFDLSGGNGAEAIAYGSNASGGAGENGAAITAERAEIYSGATFTNGDPFTLVPEKAATYTETGIKKHYAATNGKSYGKEGNVYTPVTADELIIPMLPIQAAVSAGSLDKVRTFSAGAGTAVTAAVLTVNVENVSTKIAVTYGGKTRNTVTSIMGDIAIGVIVPANDDLKLSDFKVEACD